MFFCRILFKWFFYDKINIIRRAFYYGTHWCQARLNAIPEDQIPERRAIARERQHQLAVRQKGQEIKEAREMALAGYPIEQIASQIPKYMRLILDYDAANMLTAFEMKRI